MSQFFRVLKFFSLSLLSFSFAESAIAIPLIDNQPSYTEGCPITNTAHTQNDQGDMDVRNYNCVINNVNVVWSLSVPPVCEQGGCGLIVDVHGGAMNANTQNYGTRLRQYGADAMLYGASTPYIVAQPNLTDVFDDVTSNIDLSTILFGFSAELPNMEYFISDIVSSFDVDKKRIHMHGFSYGATTVSDHYCDPQRSSLYASFSAAAGWIECDPQAGLPFMLINGQTDMGTMEASTLLEEFMLAQKGVTETTVHEDLFWTYERLQFSWESGFSFIGQHVHKRYESQGYDLESIRHSAIGFPALGHCHPVLGPERWLNCTANFDTGRKLIDFYIAHPKS